MKIKTIKSDLDIEACAPILGQLRPHLTKAKLLSQIKFQIKNFGYNLTFIVNEKNVKAVIGYRITCFLAWGKVLYIDDLITDIHSKQKGFGGALLDWAFEEAKRQECDQVHLDSGYQRNDAHRLYLNKKMLIGCHHFYKEIK